MPAAIVARTETAFTIQIEIPYGSSMLESEETIQEHLNRAGVLATREALQRFDTDGTPLVVADTKLTSMGRVLKEYQTPYGVAPVERHLYQSSRGGKTYCPLDRNARIIGSSTPRFAKIISHKYAEFGSSRVIEDLRENHGRAVARSFVQNVAAAVAAVALAQEEDWEYAPPELEGPIGTITIGMDGTCLLMCEDGWRETMVGTIGFYDRDGERQHTIYLAATPEYGKATFLDRLEREIGQVRAAYPQARYVGLGRRGEGELGVPRPAYRGPGDRLLARRRVPVRCGRCPLRPRAGGEAAVAGVKLPPAEARAGCGPAVDPGPQAAGGREGGHPGSPGGRGGDHVLHQPEQGGPDGLRPAGGIEDPDRLGGDGGGVQGSGQAATVRFGDEVEGAGCGGGVECAMPDIHDRALVAVLGQDRPGWVPGCGLTLHASEVTPPRSNENAIRAHPQNQGEKDVTIMKNKLIKKVHVKMDKELDSFP